MLQNETVWLNQNKLSMLFDVDRTVINKHIRNIYKSGELQEKSTCVKIAQVQNEGGRTVSRVVPFFNLDVIIAVGYRVNSVRATQFRIWATSVLKEHLLHGYSYNVYLSHLENKMEQKFAVHDKDISYLKEKVDFFVQTQIPPLQGVFFEGQLWDACSLCAHSVLCVSASLWRRHRHHTSHMGCVPHPSNPAHPAKSCQSCSCARAHSRAPHANPSHFSPSRASRLLAVVSCFSALH